MSDFQLTHEKQDVGQRFANMLTRERIDPIAGEIYRLHNLVRIASPRSANSAIAYCLLSNLRARCIVQGGSDPFTHMALTLRVLDTLTAEWPDVGIEARDRRIT